MMSGNWKDKEMRGRVISHGDNKTVTREKLVRYKKPKVLQYDWKWMRNVIDSWDHDPARASWTKPRNWSSSRALSRALDAFNQKTVIISRFEFLKISLADIFKKKKELGQEVEGEEVGMGESQLIGINGFLPKGCAKTVMPHSRCHIPILFFQLLLHIFLFFFPF